MKQRKAERFVTEAEKRAALKLEAEQAARFFRRTGGLLGMWNNRRVTGAMIAHGLATLEELRAAGLNAPSVLKGCAE